MPGEDADVSVEQHQLLHDRAYLVIVFAVFEVGPPYRSGEEGVPGEHELLVPHQPAQASGGVPWRGYGLEIQSGGLYLVAVAGIRCGEIMVRVSLPEPGELRVGALDDLPVGSVHVDGDAVPSLQLRRPSDVVEMPVGQEHRFRNQPLLFEQAEEILTLGLVAEAGVDHGAAALRPAYHVCLLLEQVVCARIQFHVTNRLSVP